jgi:predicted naringenin-chalcone synthase
MSLDILAIGTASPRYAMAQRDAAEVMKTFCCYNPKQARLLDTIFNHSEVRSRHSVIMEQPEGVPILERETFYPPARDEADRGPTTRQRMLRYTTEAAPLAISACRVALDKSRLPAERITHIITVSCTGFAAPGVEVAIIKALGLRPTTLRTHIGFMGCHAAINGMRVAKAIVEADPQAAVLLCAVELCSLHFYYGWDVEKVKANALFADGAAALVAVAGPAGERKEGPQAPSATENAARPPWRVQSTASCLFPDSQAAMGWTIGDNGFEMTLSAEVPDLIEKHLRGWLTEWLAAAGTPLEQIRSWAVHPGGPRIVTSVAKAMDLPDPAVAISREVLAEHGNMSSPTILFILDRLQRSAAKRPCVALGFGPGLEAEVALLV